jgi:hypothetical protein
MTAAIQDLETVDQFLFLRDRYYVFKQPGLDVMITIFVIFAYFRRNNLAFF